MERTDDESNKQPVILPPMIRIAYCTPSLHIPGGVERVLTTKANYLAENGNYDIYILLTDGKGKPPCYTLSPKVKIIQLDIDFEELWELPLWKKSAGLSEKTKNIPTQALCRLVSPQTGHHSFFVTTGNKLYHFPQRWKQKDRGATRKPEKLS